MATYTASLNQYDLNSDTYYFDVLTNDEGSYDVVLNFGENSFTIQDFSEPTRERDYARDTLALAKLCQALKEQIAASDDFQPEAIEPFTFAMAQ